MPVCRYWNCVDTVTTYYIYSNGRVIAEYDDDGDLVWNYVYGLGQRVARYNGNNKQIYHNDHLGNMRAITDTLGAAALATADYYPFGEMLSVTGAPGRFTYNGNELDDEYGFDLYYYGARYMDPASGRFITPDPVRDFYNPYSYVHNNPMNRIDPTGMYSPPVGKNTSCTGYEFKRRSDPFGWIEGGMPMSKMEEILHLAIRAAERMVRNAARNGNSEKAEKYMKLADNVKEVLFYDNRILPPSYDVSDLAFQKQMGWIPENAEAAVVVMLIGEDKVVLPPAFHINTIYSVNVERAVSVVLHEFAEKLFIEENIDNFEDPEKFKKASDIFALETQLDYYLSIESKHPFEHMKFVNLASKIGSHEAAKRLHDYLHDPFAKELREFMKKMGF